MIIFVKKKICVGLAKKNMAKFRYADILVKLRSIRNRYFNVISTQSLYFSCMYIAFLNNTTNIRSSIHSFVLDFYEQKIHSNPLDAHFYLFFAPIPENSIIPKCSFMCLLSLLWVEPRLNIPNIFLCYKLSLRKMYPTRIFGSTTNVYIACPMSLCLCSINANRNKNKLHQIHVNKQQNKS